MIEYQINIFSISSFSFHALLLQIVSDHQNFVMLIACWVREFASVAWKPARKSACSVSCFVVAIRRVWPRIFVLVSA